MKPDGGAVTDAHIERRRMVRAAGVIALLTGPLVSNACSERPRTPTGPMVVPAPSPPHPTLVVSGTVSIRDELIANATVDVRGWTVQTVRTDNDGRYRAEIENDGPTQVWVTASHERYPYQPCAAWFEQTALGNQERSIDIQLMSLRGAFFSRAASVSDRRSVTGTAVTMTAGEKKPVADAGVAWDTSGIDRKAWTDTNASGRFGLCGLPVDRPLSIVVQRDGKSARPVISPGTTDVDIEVVLE